MVSLPFDTSSFEKGVYVSGVTEEGTIETLNYHDTNRNSIGSYKFKVRKTRKTQEQEGVANVGS